MPKYYYTVQLTMLVHRTAEIAIESDVPIDKDAQSEAMAEAYEITDGSEFVDDKPSWGEEEGEHTWHGELTEEQAKQATHLIKLRKS
jgi:hypothetical protein